MPPFFYFEHNRAGFAAAAQPAQRDCYRCAEHIRGQSPCVENTQHTETVPTILLVAKRHRISDFLFLIFIFSLLTN